MPTTLTKIEQCAQALRTDVSVLEQADFIGWYKAPWFV